MDEMVSLHEWLVGKMCHKCAAAPTKAIHQRIKPVKYKHRTH